MGEALQDSIKCNNCDTIINLSDDECFNERIFCDNCSEDFNNYGLEDFLKKFAKTYLGERIEFHIENNKLWVDAKNAAIYLGFYDKSNNPNRGKINSLCNKNILCGYQKKKRSKWEIEGSSLYYYQRLKKKEEGSTSVSKTAKLLNVSKNEVMRRIHLNRDDPDWIRSEPKIYTRHIIYLNNHLK